MRLRLSLSRLSNVVRRLEQRGWMQRSPDPDNGHYTIVRLTDAGYDKVVSAAPTLVRAVRRFALDGLTATDQRALVRVAAKLSVRPWTRRRTDEGLRTSSGACARSAPGIDGLS